MKKKRFFFSIETSAFLTRYYRRFSHIACFCQLILAFYFWSFVMYVNNNNREEKIVEIRPTQMIACYSHLRRLFLIIIEIFEKKRRKAPFCSIELCSRQSLNRRKKVFFIFYEINGKGNEFARVNEQISIEVQRQFSPMKKNQPKEIEFFSLIFN